MYAGNNEHEHELYIPLWMIAEFRDCGAVRYHTFEDNFVTNTENDDLRTAITLFGGAIFVLPSTGYIRLTDEALVVCWPKLPKTDEAVTETVKAPE